MKITRDTRLEEVVGSCSIPVGKYLNVQGKSGERYSGNLKAVGLDFMVLQVENQDPVYIAINAIESLY